MLLAHDAAYEVLKARDARFDGRLFVGVTSTGIYCRPVCRVRIPKPENCRFFASPALAEASHFRPCLKCRPEIAPGPARAWSAMDASRTLALQAAHWLDGRVGDGGAPAIAALADHLGVSDRHLRRIFAAEHGVTPLQYLQTRRLLLAKQLLTDTRLPVTAVALASGFLSLRRFNAAFAAAYRMNPSALRRSAGDGPLDGDGLVVHLALRPPYDQDALLRFLAVRAVPGVEHVAGAVVRRSVRAGVLHDTAGWIEVAFDPRLPLVRLRFAPSLAPASARVIATVRRWLDLDADPATIDAALAGLPGVPGQRLPASVDAFEMAVRAVLGQQVTVAAARTLARRLVDRFGTAADTPWPEIDRTFPSPALLAATPVEHIAELGIIRSRAGAIVALAAAWPQLAERMHADRTPERLIEDLCALPGIGPWTAHYLAMRATGWPDAFPPKDVAVLNALKLACGTTSPKAAEQMAEQWRPWRSYAVLRLWNSLTPAASASASASASAPALAPASTVTATALPASAPEAATRHDARRSLPPRGLAR